MQFKACKCITVNREVLVTWKSGQFRNIRIVGALKGSNCAEFRRSSCNQVLTGVVSNFKNLRFDPPAGFPHGICIICEIKHQERHSSENRGPSECNGTTRIEIRPLGDFCPPMQIRSKLWFFSTLQGNNAKIYASSCAMLPEDLRTKATLIIPTKAHVWGRLPSLRNLLKNSTFKFLGENAIFHNFTC